MAVALKQPGWYRGALGTIIGAAFGFGLVIALRAISGLDVFQTEQTGYPHVIVPLVTAPFGFLIGFGAFDYWFRWAAGKPTVPDDHSGHGATRWQDYFKFNTDHKVIGIQYVVTTLGFFMIGGLLALLIRAELAQPGTQVVDPNVYNGLFSTHAIVMIFLFIIPMFAGLANYVVPLMIGAPDMAFPQAERAQLLAAADRRHHLPRQLPRPWRRLRCRLDRLRPVVHRGSGGAIVLQHRRAVRGCIFDRDRAQLPGHDHHDESPRDESLADAAARLGQPFDLADRRRLRPRSSPAPSSWSSSIAPSV